MCRRGSASPGPRSTHAAPSCAAAPGCSSIACRCVRWQTLCCRLAIPPTSRNCSRPTSACRRLRRARRRSRLSWAARSRSVTLVNLTTMNRNLQNAYSRQAQRGGGAAARRSRHGQRGLSVRARPGSADVHQSERAELRRRAAPTTAAGRFPPTPTTASIRPRETRTTTACTCRSFSGRRAGATTASATRCRSR